MNRFLIFLFSISIILSFTAISLEGIPVQKSPEHLQEIKILLTTNLIEHSQTGLHLFPKDDLEKMTSSVVSKFQELLLEKHE